MDDFWNPSPDTVERCDEDRPLDERHLWPQDTEKLPYDARCALLQLIKGPYIDESDPLWSAVLNNQQDLSSHLADMLLELYVDAETGIAFARNASTGERTVLKATRSNVMTLLDTIMVLTLRKELQMGGTNRVFIGQSELFEQLAQYRRLESQDQSSYQSKLKASWNRLVEARILLKSDIEDRFEISPVLKLIFGTEEAAAVSEEFELMLKRAQQAVPNQGEPHDDDR